MLGTALEQRNEVSSGFVDKELTLACSSSIICILTKQLQSNCDVVMVKWLDTRIMVLLPVFLQC